jgi:hypothetical protein
MCWESNKKPEQRTAKKDTIVYKLLLTTFNPNIMISPIAMFEYTFHHKYKNSPMKVEIEIEKGNTKYKIYEGFHSFSTLKNARNIYLHAVIHNITYVRAQIVECIIPKDSHYYRNGDCCVSDSIIINKIVDKPWTNIF